MPTQKLVHICSSVVPKSQKVATTQISINLRMDKQVWCTHAADYYLVMKRNEGQRHPTAWVYLEDMMLSKISQSQNPHILWFHIYDMPRIRKHMGVESR